MICKVISSKFARFVYVEVSFRNKNERLLLNLQSYAEITATQKKLEKQKEQALIVAADWYRRAQLALEKGDEELAREALSRRQTQLDSAENLSKQLTIQTNAVDKLYSSMTLLEQKISEAKRQKEASLNSILF